MSKHELDWSVVSNCKPLEGILDTEEKINTFKEALEIKTKERFKEHSKKQRECWTKAAHMFLD